MSGFLTRLALRLVREKLSTAPDFIIGRAHEPYLCRWFIIPRNRWFNIYLHDIRRSDDDRALHDHPWVNLSWVLGGGYWEHTIDAGGINRRVWRGPGALKLRPPSAAHRLEVEPGCPATTLFITGPRVREWGFHCPRAGWVHWKDFTAGDRGELIGAGCGEESGQ